MSKEEKIKNIAEKTSPIFQKYGIKYAGIFGSYARGEEKEESDVDILVKRGNQTLSLLDFIGIKDELEEILDKKVDLNVLPPEDKNLEDTARREPKEESGIVPLKLEYRGTVYFYNENRTVKGKPMKYNRKNTRELYISPYRIAYAYISSENKLIFLDLYHKDEQ